MSAGYNARSVLKRGIAVPASQATAAIATVALNNGGELNIKVDCFIGQVASTPVLKLQDSMGYDIWTTVKTGSALSASTDITVTPDFTTGIFTATSHGLSNGNWVALNSTGKNPGGLDAQEKLFVQNATTNTFQLARAQPVGSLPASFSDNGSGTITVTLVTVSTLALNVNVAGDQAVMPLRPTGRVIATTTGGQTVQVLDVRAAQHY